MPDAPVAKDHSGALVGPHRPPAIGIAQAGDGDGLTINGQRIRLHAIDAPEIAQPMGPEAAAALRNLVDGKEVICVHRDTDRYGRMVGQCRVGVMDIGAALVRQGFAHAFVQYGADYIHDEAAAKAGGIGVWGLATVETPWDYRARMRRQ